MVTEAKTENPTPKPTESEIAELTDLAKRIRKLNNAIDRVLDRMAFQLPVTQDERTQMIRDQVELERLLLRAEIRISKFG